MVRTFAALGGLSFLALTSASCAVIHNPEATRAPAEAVDAERALAMAWDVPIPGRTRVELWIRAGSLDGDALVAAAMAEVWAARAQADPWVTPSLTVLSLESKEEELSERTERLLAALRAPVEEEELERALSAIEVARRRQARAPEREAVSAAFAGMGMPHALPFGEEVDPRPTRDDLERFARRAIATDRVRVLFIGAVPRRLLRRAEQTVASLGAAEVTGRGGDRPPERAAVTVREAEPAWALVATLGSLPLALSIERALAAGPVAAGDVAIALAPSRRGVFLVVSGRGAPEAAQIRTWSLELRRLASWTGPLERSPADDLRQRAREESLRFAAAAGREGEVGAIALHLGVTSEDLEAVDAAALEAALGAPPPPAAVAVAPSNGEPGVRVRFPALFSGEPASEAGRGALLLRALRLGCAKLGLSVTASSVRGDGALEFSFEAPPRLAALQKLARCVAHESPRALTWEGVRAELLDELARDPLQPALEAAAAALYPASPSSALPLHTRALRHRSGDGRLAEALGALRTRSGLEFSVTGKGAEEIAAQLGALAASLPPSSSPPRPLATGRPVVGPAVVDIDAPSVLLAGVRLDHPAPEAALAFVSRWAERARDAGLPILRAHSGGHASEGFALLVVPLGASDPESLRRALERATPPPGELDDALEALARDRAYRSPRWPHEPGPERAPRVAGRAYALGLERD